MTVITKDIMEKALWMLSEEGGGYTTIQSVATELGLKRTTLSSAINRGYKPQEKTCDQGGLAEPLDDKPISGGYLYDPNDLRCQKPRGEGVYVLTSAQNNTDVWQDWIDVLHNYCRIRDAFLMVGGFTYNRNGWRKPKDDDTIWYDPSIRDYIVDRPIKLADDFVFCAELNISPTSVKGTTNMASYLRGGSGCVPFAKQQLESLPSIYGEDSTEAKIVYTTGTCTLRNYQQKRTGQFAEKNHVFSALVVEVDSQGDWFARHITAENETGHIQDMEYYFTKDDCYKATVEAINWGDIHVEKHDPVVSELQWGIARDEDGSFYATDKKDSIVDCLWPAHQLFNDTLDMSFRNHHNLKDSDFMYKQWAKGEESVEDSVKMAASFINAASRNGCTSVIVESNHDRALNKWLGETGDFRTDPVNALYFLNLNHHRYKCMKNNLDPFVFKYAMRKAGVDESVVFLEEDESFIIAGNVEVGQHGHLGVDGSRGSLQGFRRLGYKINAGHVHKAWIFDGVFYAGISCSMKLGYNKGPSTWNWSLIITYSSGKRAIATIRNGKWRANWDQVEDFILKKEDSKLAQIEEFILKNS